MGVASIFLRTDRFLIDVKDKFVKKVEYENLIFFVWWNTPKKVIGIKNDINDTKFKHVLM